MTQAQLPINPWLSSYISQHAKAKSRYEIDKYLIEAGYDPAEIEMAWQTEEQPPAPSSVVPIFQPSKTSRVAYIVVGAVLLSQVVFMLTGSSGVTFSSGTMAGLMGLVCLIKGLAPVPHSRRVELTILLLVGLITLFSIGLFVYYLFLR